MKYKGFIDDNTDDILSEIDKAIMERDIRRIREESLETGIIGMLAYVNCHLMTKRDISYIPFDEDYLFDVYKIAEKFDIMEKSIEMDKIWEECVRIFSQYTNHSWKKVLSILCQYVRYNSKYH